MLPSAPMRHDFGTVLSALESASDTGGGIASPFGVGGFVGDPPHPHHPYRQRCVALADKGAVYLLAPERGGHVNAFDRQGWFL